MSRGRQYSRALIHQMHEAEAKICAKVDDQVKRLPREQVTEIEHTIAAPKNKKPDYRRYAYV